MTNLEQAVGKNETVEVAEVPNTPAVDAPSTLNPTDVAAAAAAEAARRGTAGAAGTTEAQVGSDGINFPAAGKDGQGGKTSDNPADNYVDSALRTAEQMNSVGWSARGVRLALQAAGETDVPTAHAANLGAALAQSGKYDVIPFDPSKAQPGDILVRPWSQSYNNSRGGVGYGDIMIITGRNADGSLRGANDHVVNRVQPEGNHYEGSYFLRRRPG